MPLTRDEIQTLADTHYGDEAYVVPHERAFAMLVEIANHVYELYREADPIDLDDPASFLPATLGGAPHGFTLIMGLVENLEMAHPDGNFRSLQ